MATGLPTELEREQKIFVINFNGQATSLAHIRDAYIISNLTGHKEQLRVPNPAKIQETWAIEEIEPIATGAPVYLTYRWVQPIPVSDFLNQWGAFEFHVTYDNKEYVRSYAQDYVNDKLAREMPGVIGPRITKKPAN